MKRDVATLSGIELNYAVAQINGMLRMVSGSMEEQLGVYSPSTKWQHGGPIIEREGIELWKWKGDDGTYWCSHVGGRPVDTDAKESIGETPLVAAMRAFVSTKMGTEVDL